MVSGVTGRGRVVEGERIDGRVDGWVVGLWAVQVKGGHRHSRWYRRHTVKPRRGYTVYPPPIPDPLTPLRLLHLSYSQHHAATTTLRVQPYEDDDHTPLSVTLPPATMRRTAHYPL